MNDKKEILVNNVNWHAIAANDGSIYVAAMDGTLANISLATGVISSKTTSLDIPYLFPATHSVTAIGRWDTRLLTWNVRDDSLEIKAPMVSGRITAISGNKLRYIAGSNKFKNADSSSSKDRVKLAPGQIFQLDKDNEPILLPVKSIGQITFLAASKSTIAFVDSSEKATVIIYKIPSGDRMVFPSEGQVTRLAATSERLFISTDRDVTEIDVTTDFTSKSKALPADFFRVLKLVPSGDEVYLLTSEGVYALSNLNRISAHSGQPSDIAGYKNGVLTLWQDGTIEHNNPNTEMKSIHIGK